MTSAAAGFIPKTGPSFAGSVRSELLKIRRQALFWVLLGLGAAATVITLLAFLISQGGSQLGHPLPFYLNYLAGLQFLFDTASGIVLLVITARLAGMEYSSGTIRVVLARGTSRPGLLLAQLLALALVGLAMLVAFAVLAAAFLYVVVVHDQGSFSAISGLPSVAWRNTGLTVLVALVSMGTCILLGLAAASIGRSLAFAVGFAMAFFPADNFGTLVMFLIQRGTQQSFWPNLTQWFLGPALNNLPAVLEPNQPAASMLASPLVKVGLTETWLVIAGWDLVFLVAALILSWRRDVLE